MLALVACSLSPVTAFAGRGGDVEIHVITSASNRGEIEECG
jgi:hypothetical protein